jgi:molybdenum cofactor biosynthesis enzyme MoaA
MDMGLMLPDERIWKLASSGENYAVWENMKPVMANKIVHKPLDQDEAVHYVGLAHNVPIKIQLVNTMSMETQKRILEEYPELINSRVQERDEINKANQY